MKAGKRRLTAFQVDVLKATLSIPLGETRSYQWVAQAIGKPAAVRAVGQALRRNPYPVLIPCHRVVKSDGSLGGYLGAGDAEKRKLLSQEQDIMRRILPKMALKKHLDKG